MFCPRCGSQTRKEQTVEIVSVGLFGKKQQQPVFVSRCPRCGYAERISYQAFVAPDRPAYQEPEKKNEGKQGVDILVPKRIGDAIRVYYYDKVRIDPAPNALEMGRRMQETNFWELDTVQDGEKIDLYYQGQRFAQLLDRVDMVKDWLIRGDPIKTYLKHLGENENYAFIAFFRNEMKRLENREHSITKLIRYSNEDAQFCLNGIEPGDMLELEEDNMRENVVNVLYCGGEIGALPKKYATRYLDEDCYRVFLDHLDTDDDYKDVPYVRIYW